MNYKELNLIKEIIGLKESEIKMLQNHINYEQHTQFRDASETKRIIQEDETIIKIRLEEIATLQSIYRIVKEALKNGKTNN